MANQRLLCITAHPDDEAGGFGGSLSLYHSRGVETYVICLTPGQAATHRGGFAAGEELAAVRRTEFAAACEILEVTHGEVLDHSDGRLDQLPVNTVVGELVKRIRRLRPQVIVTFGPEGGITAHLDHGMASIFATLAFHWAARTDRYAEQLQNGVTPHRTQKLYYSTATFAVPGRPPVAMAPLTTVIDITAHAEAKIRAFKAHATQAPLFPVLEKSLQQRGNRESFHLVAGTRLGPTQAETDLFAGVE